MISLDPERDTVEALADYVPYFNDQFIGVTGNKHLIRRLTAEINIAYNKVPLAGDDYTVDHSTQLVLINPKGHYHGFLKRLIAKRCCAVPGAQSTPLFNHGF